MMPNATVEIEYRTYRWCEKTNNFGNCIRTGFLLALFCICEFIYFTINGTTDRGFSTI